MSATEAAFAPLPRLAGQVDYLARGGGRRWGVEEWTITRSPDGLRTFAAQCEMRFPGSRAGAGGEWVVRHSVLSVDSAHQPREAYVRIMRDGRLTGTGWFLFDGQGGIECESWTRDEGRIRQHTRLEPPLRGFGVHAVQGDGWLAAPFPWAKGPGHTHFWGRNAIHSLHHFGATGPFVHTSGSGLTYVGDEEVTVPAGAFRCRRVAFAGLTNAHPPYDMWVTADDDVIYVLGVVEGYMDSRFELTRLTRENGA